MPNQKKKIWKLCVGLGIPVLLIALLAAQIPAFVTGMRSEGTPMAIAHRGASLVAPENTIPAYEKALKMGITAVETDAFYTGDSKIVLSHDGTIDRCSNGTGRIIDMSLEMLRQYDFGSWFGEEFAGTQIPTLDEFLDTVKDAEQILLEFKVERVGIVRPMVDMVREHGLMDKVIFQSFALDSLQACKEYAPEAKVAFLYHARSDYAKEARKDPAGFCRQYNLDALHPNFGGVNASFVRRCKAAGIPLRVWTVNTPVLIAGLSALGVDGIITDMPEKVSEAASGSALKRGLSSVVVNLHSIAMF